MLFSFVLGNPHGYKKIWFIGDDFGHKTFSEFFFEREPSDYCGYARENFEVSGFMGDSFKSLDTNLISRMRGTFLKAIKDKVLLPKMVVLVPDDDIINYLKGRGSATSYSMGKVLHWIMSEFARLVAGHKDQLQKRARKTNYPHFIWIQAPLHKYFSKENAQL